MSTSRVAVRYAKSLVMLAQEKGLLEAVKDDMMMIRDTCQQSRDLRMLLSSPIVTNDKKLKVLKALFGAKISELTSAFLDILSRKNRENILPDVSKDVIRQYNIIKGIQLAQVTTAFPLDAALRKRFIEIVKEVTGKEVELVEEVKESIIGGFLLTVGDQQLDDTIATKLKKLKLQLMHA